MSLLVRRFAILSLGLVTISLVGCGAAGDTPKAQEATSATAETAGDHTGWWCNEHGIPEESCARCDPKVAEALKAKGDWCRKHDRPDSQCFVCHPEHAKAFAALYEAKLGHAPPKRNDEPVN
jgi:hypothetical protein